MGMKDPIKTGLVGVGCMKTVSSRWTFYLTFNAYAEFGMHRIKIGCICGKVHTL